MKIIACLIVLICLVAKSVAATNDDLSAIDQISKLQKEYDKQTASLDRTSKDTAGIEMRAIVNLLESCSDNERQMQYEYLLRHPATNSAPTFENLLVEAFIMRLTASNQLSSVSSLLATHCPEYIGLAPLEWWLAFEKGPSFMSIMTSA